MSTGQKRSRTYYSTVIENSDYGLHPSTPDVYGNKKRAKRELQQQLQQISRSTDDDPYDDDLNDAHRLEVVSDSIATAQYLINNVMLGPKDRLANNKLPRVCFIHQIYSILRDNTMVDREIQQAVKAGTWRKFHIFGTLDDEYVLMDSNDYLRTIQDAKQEFIKDVADGINKDGRSVDAGVFDRFGQLLTKGQCFDTMITRQALLSPAFPSNPEGFTDKELTQLCKYGLLLPHMKKDSYWFAIRRQGVFMSSFLKGRAEMLRILKKRSTKDIMEKLLKAKRLRQTVFTHDFILHDLMGSGRAERYKTPMGDLIKLTRKGELGQ